MRIVFRLMNTSQRCMDIFGIILFSILMNNPTKESSNNHIIRSSPSQMFCKISVLKNFEKFIEKHLCQSLFSIKLQAEKFLKILKKAPVLESRF